MNKSLKVIPLVSWFDKINVTDSNTNRNQDIVEFSFLCAKFAYLLRDINIYYKFDITEKIARKYFPDLPKRSISKFLYKLAQKNDWMFRHLTISLSYLLYYGYAPFFKNDINTTFSLVNKKITDEFHYVGRILTLTLYGLCGGRNEIKRMVNSLRTAEKGLKRIILKKNSIKTFKNKIEYNLEKDIKPEYIIQLFFNIIISYLENANYNNYRSEGKIKTKIINLLGIENTKLSKINELIRPYIDSLLPQFTDYRAFFRGDYNSNISNNEIIKIKDIPLRSSINTIIVDVDPLLSFPKNFSRRCPVNDILFTNISINEYYEELLKYIIINDESYRSSVYFLPSSEEIENTIIEKHPRTKFNRYPEIILSHELLPVERTDNTLINNSSTTDSIVDKNEDELSEDNINNECILFNVSNDFIDLSTIRTNQKYKVRITSDDNPKFNDIISLGTIEAYIDSAKKLIHTIKTRGINLSDDIIREIISTYHKKSNSLDITSTVLFDKKEHNYSNNK